MSVGEVKFFFGLPGRRRATGKVGAVEGVPGTLGVLPHSVEGRRRGGERARACGSSAPPGKASSYTCTARNV